MSGRAERAVGGVEGEVTVMTAPSTEEETRDQEEDDIERKRGGGQEQRGVVRHKRER
jgi:hypothetical protein